MTQTATATGPCHLVTGWVRKEQAYIGACFTDRQDADKFRKERGPNELGCLSLPAGSTEKYVVYKPMTTDEYMEKISEWAGDYQGSGRD